MNRLEKYFTYFICFTALSSFAQTNRIGINTINPAVTLDVNGAIRVGNDASSSSSSGTIRFNPETGEFEGYDGAEWRPFGYRPHELYWPQRGDRGSISTYDPYSPNDASQGDQFGFAVDIDGDYAVVGSPGYNGNYGRVVVLKKSYPYGFWGPVDTLTGDGNTEKFGYAVSISGNKILVGAPHHKVFVDPFLHEQGKLYFYERTGNQFNLTDTYLNGSCYTNLGHSVDLQGIQWAAGAVNVSFPTCSNPQNNGAVLTADSNNPPYWLTCPNISPTGINQFGFDVSLYNNWLVVGAPFSQTTVNEDSVYIFHKPLGGTYSFFQSIGPFLTAEDQTGYSVAIHNGKMVIGTPKEDKTGPASNSGTARIYYLDTNPTLQWTESLVISGGANQGMFGHAVACDSEYEMISANIAGIPPSPQLTYIQATKLIDGRFQPYVTITDPAATIDDNFVNDVAISGRYFIIGLPYGVSFNGQPGGRVFIGQIR